MPLPAFIVEIEAADAISTTGLFVLGASSLGGAHVLGVDPRWTAVPATDVQQIGIRRGRVREDSSVDVGTATIVLDGYSGNYDPDNSAGTYFYTYGGVNLLRVGVAVRVRVTIGGTDYTLFTGTLESTSSTFGRQPEVTWTCVDRIDHIGHYGVAPLGAFQRSGETSAARAAWLMEYAQVAAADYSVPATGRTLAHTNGGGTVLSMLESLARSEVGRVFADRTGKIIVRWNASEVGRSTVLTFSDAVSATVLDYEDISVEPGIVQVVNEAHVTTRTIGTDDEGRWIEVDTTFGAVDGTSVGKFGARPVSIDTQMNLAADAQTLANYLSTYRATPATRPASVRSSLAGQADARLVEAVSLELGDWIAVARTTPDGRSLSWTVAVEGIDHTISTTDWQMTVHNAPTATAITW